MGPLLPILYLQLLAKHAGISMEQLAKKGSGTGRKVATTPGESRHRNQTSLGARKIFS